MIVNDVKGGGKWSVASGQWSVEEGTGIQLGAGAHLNQCIDSRDVASNSGTEE